MVQHAQRQECPEKNNDNNNREETCLNTLAVLEFGKGKIATFCLVKFNSISVP